MKKAFVSQRVEALEREPSRGSHLLYQSLRRSYLGYAKSEKRVAARGIKSCTFGRMLWPAAKNEDLDEKLAAFAEELKAGKGGDQ